MFDGKEKSRLKKSEIYGDLPQKDCMVNTSNAKLLDK